MRKVTFGSELENGTNVQVYKPYSGVWIPTDAHKWEGYDWGKTSYTWTRR